MEDLLLFTSLYSPWSEIVVNFDMFTIFLLGWLILLSASMPIAALMEVILLLKILQIPHISWKIFGPGCHWQEQDWATGLYLWTVVTLYNHLGEMSSSCGAYGWVKRYYLFLVNITMNFWTSFPPLSLCCSTISLSLTNRICHPRWYFIRWSLFFLSVAQLYLKYSSGCYWKNLPFRLLSCLYQIEWIPAQRIYAGFRCQVTFCEQ